MAKKSERWRKKDEDRIKKLLLMRFGVIFILGSIGVGALYLFNKNEPVILEKKQITQDGMSSFGDNVNSVNIGGDNPISYDNAIKNVSLRQGYIDQHFGRSLPYFVSNVVYDPDNRRAINHLESFLSEDYIDEEMLVMMKKDLSESISITTHLMRIFLSSEIFGKKIKQPIFVTRRAFEKYNEREFRKALEDHEFIHAEDLFYGVRIGDVLINFENSHNLQQNTINAVFDLRALHNQMKVSALKGEEPDEIFLQAMRGFVIYYQMLKDVKPQNDLERYVRGNQLEYFDRFMTLKMKSNLMN